MNARSTRKAPRPAAKGASRKSPKSVTRKAGRKTSPAASTERGSKQSQLIEALRSPSGGTIEQLTQLTGWQAHSVRGVISSALRKRLNLNVVCAAGSAGTRVYRIVEAAA